MNIIDMIPSKKWYINSGRIMWRIINTKDISSIINSSLQKAIETRWYRQLSTTPPNLFEYCDWSFTLVNSEPESDYMLDWNFTDVYNQYVDKVMYELLPIMNLSVNSQTILYGGIDTSLYSIKQMYKSEKTVNTIDVKQIEEYFDTSWNRPSMLCNHSFEIVINIPPKDFLPLYIIDNKKKLSESFLIWNWGGLTIWNNISTLSNSTISTDDMYHVFENVVTQMRVLIGLPSNACNTNKFYQCIEATVDQQNSHDIYYPIIFDWEIDILLRSYIKHYLKYAIDNLESLKELIKSSPQMPVDEHIVSIYMKSVNKVKLVKHLLSIGAYKDAIIEASLAAEYAHSAFYDSSMMPLLHFPIEHILAIFAPFFLPLILHLIRATIQYMKAN